MNKILLLTLILISQASHAEKNHDSHSNEESHDMSESNHDMSKDKKIDGSKYKLNTKRYMDFIKGLSEVQIAIVDVKGMVCDFCARGITKTFYKDTAVVKVDVDLETGKIFIAYSKSTKVDFEDIKEKITKNGQTATTMQIKKL